MSCFSLNGYGYFVGGTASGATLNELWRYDPLTDSWSEFAPIPIGRYAATAFTINGKGYVSCGLTGWSMLNDLWEYDPIADSWTAKAFLPSAERYGAVGFSINGLGYVGTGNTGSANGPYVSDLWAYDPLLDQWALKAPLPDQERYGSTAFALNGNAYILCGHQQDLTNTNELWKYDPNSNSWSAVASLPSSPRTYSITLPAIGLGIVSAGADAGVHSFDSWYYEPVFGYWHSLPAYPGGSGWLGVSLSINDRIFAGLGSIGGTEHDDFWELREFAYPTEIVELVNSETSIQVGHDPSLGRITIRSDLDVGNLIRLFDASGRMIHSSEIGVAGSSFAISVEALAPGPYLVQLVNGTGSKTGRVVIAR